MAPESQTAVTEADHATTLQEQLILLVSTPGTNRTPENISSGHGEGGEGRGSVGTTRSLNSPEFRFPRIQLQNCWR